METAQEEPGPRDQAPTAFPGGRLPAVPRGAPKAGSFFTLNSQTQPRG